MRPVSTILSNTSAAAVCLAFSLPMPAASQPAGIRIAESGQRFASIQAAVDAASAGQTVEVVGGRYQEQVTIRKSVSLRGIDGGSGPPEIDARGRNVAVQLLADRATIEGFRISITTTAAKPFDFFSLISDDACVLSRSGSNVIRNNVIEGCQTGIVVSEGRDVLIENNIVSKNRNAGIEVKNSKGGIIRNNEVRNNGYEGIGLSTQVFPPETRSHQELITENFQVVSNQVSGHGFGGIGIGFARRNTVADNFVTRNGGAKVPAARGGASMALSMVKGIEGYGILLNCDGYENRVLANKVENNTNIGIFLETSHNNEFARNAVTGSSSGIDAVGSYGNTFSENRVFLNARYGIRLTRGIAAYSPSVGNLLFRNDLDRNATNAFDTSGVDIAPAVVHGRTSTEVKGSPPAPADLRTPNRWDNDQEGNHHSDFDQPSQGFVDQNHDGIGEVGKRIPGGSAVDRFPLAAAPALGGLLPFDRTFSSPTSPRCADLRSPCGIAARRAGSCG
jgi:parallel beta-helix repeat protein